ncbi:MAG: sulfurtransferase [Pseudomonadota bacterium]
MTYANPQYLIDVPSLNNRLGEPNLKIFDTAVHLIPQPAGTYLVNSGRSEYEAAHIPGAAFIDLADDWADTDSNLRFTLPSLEDLQSAIGKSGISAQDQVVLYSSGHMMWATRAWWLLRYAGHNNCAILNGSLTAWRDAGLTLAAGAESYPPASFQGPASTAAFADTAEVEAGMDGRICTINALNQALYEGTGDFFYERRGHIPGSVLLAFDDLLDNHHFLDAESLRSKLQSSGMLDADRVITYCGGGIAATLDAFAGVLLGQQNIGVYDGSMSEWVQDPNRPLREGATP